MNADIAPDNLALVRRHYDDLVNRGDLSAAERDLSEDFVDHAAPPGTQAGPGAVKGWITMIRSAFPDITVTEEMSVADGDKVAVGAVWRGRHDGPFLGIEPTGRNVEMRGIVMWRVVDGRLAERWAVLDYEGLLHALR